MLYAVLRQLLPAGHFNKYYSYSKRRKANSYYLVLRAAFYI